MPVTAQDKFLYVGVSRTAFRCECGCNVFRACGENQFRCNACKATYTCEREEASATPDHQPGGPR